MEDIARVKMKRTLKTGRTSASKLFEEGMELTPPFPRIIKEEYARNPQYFEILEKKSEPEKPKVEKPSKPRAKLNV